MKRLFIATILLAVTAIGYTKDIVVPYTLADRDRIMRMEEKLIAIDQRFDSIDQRFDSIDKRFEQMTSLMIGIIGVMGAMVAIFIGLLVWDRRSALKPFEDKLRSTDAIVADNSEKTMNLIESL